MITTAQTRLLVRLLAAVLAVFTLAACMNTDQQTAFDMVNRSRAVHGRSALVEDASATSKAQAWAEHLAAKGSLSHSDLRAGVGPGWRAIAENVGYGSSISHVHDGYMKSPGHRANILDGKYTHMGVGVAKAGDRVYTAIVFVQR